MSDFTPFEDEPTDTVDRILQSTYHALQKYGYANLSIAKIADGAGLSKAALYNHYGGKDDLLLDFLDRFLDSYLSPALNTDVEGSYEELQALIQLLSVDSLLNGDGRSVFTEPTVEAFVELRTQAIHDEAFRAELLSTDQAIHDRFKEIIQRGIDEGVFYDVEVSATAEFILTVLEGAFFRYSLAKNRATCSPYVQLDRYIRDFLVVKSSK